MSITTSDGCCPVGANANTDVDCRPECGNGVLEGEESCESESDTWHCSDDCRRRSAYTRCSQDEDCRDEATACYLGVCAKQLEQPYALDQCPRVRSHHEVGVMFEIGCVISCFDVADCPPHLNVCEPNPFSQHDRREAFGFCTYRLPQQEEADP